MRLVSIERGTDPHFVVACGDEVGEGKNLLHYESLEEMFKDLAI